MKKSLFIFPVIIIIAAGALFVYREKISAIFTEKKVQEEKTPAAPVSDSETKITAPSNNKQFADDFSHDQTLAESSPMSSSKSTSWWVNSGAYLFVKNGVASTVQGSLDTNNSWRTLYNKNDPGETDNGYHPQNIFRLVTKSKWTNFEQSSYFFILNNNFSSDSHRDASNGLLLFNRYKDGNNLYYTGIRVDGTAVIKKKIKGTYYTMAQKKVFEGEYERSKNQSLLPQKQWIGVKSEVKTNSDNSVDIGLYVDEKNDQNWKLVLKATDDGNDYGGKAFTGEGYAGIRTDFMDVEFDNYEIMELS